MSWLRRRRPAPAYVRPVSDLAAVERVARLAAARKQAQREFDEALGLRPDTDAEALS